MVQDNPIRFNSGTSVGTIRKENFLEVGFQLKQLPSGNSAAWN